MSQPRKKRRPTRTPKPSGQKSRLCSPSPFLDRSFHRKKLLFAASKKNDDSESSSDAERSDSLEYDAPSDAGTGSDSEYNIADDLSELQHDEREDQYHGDGHDEEEAKSHDDASLLSDIENLQISRIGGDSPRDSPDDSPRDSPRSSARDRHRDSAKLARNARVSVKMHRASPLQNVQTPQLFIKQHSKIKKRKSKTESNKSNKSTKSTKCKVKMSNESDQIKDVQQTKASKKVSKKTVVRITRSSKVFSKAHTFGTLLVKPAECGSGCPLYRSTWKDEETVTKLMPLWENAEFTKEENVDNALREFEFHADVYRKGCKAYGVADCPVVSIMACVKLRHPVVTTEENEDQDAERQRAYKTRAARRAPPIKKVVVKKPYLAFVMPQLHCNLTQFVQKYRKLTEEEGRRLLLTGVRFLNLLRECDMVHCDIKPENIFLDVTREHDEPTIRAFVFGDFGCAAKTTEEFPYGSLTGTVTMWDLAALGSKYGKENGFDAKNDLYGVLGSLLDGMYGGSIMEELLEEENEEWEDTDWPQYTKLIRMCRAKQMEDGFMRTELEDMGCDDPVLQTALMQIGRRRKDRITLEELVDLVGH